MRMLQGLMGAVTGGAKWVLGGAAGAWAANRFWPGAQGGVQNTLGDIAETALEIESIAAGQNGNIDNWMAGLNSIQGITGWLSGISALLFKLTGWDGFRDFANNMADFRAEEQARIQGEGLRMGQTSLTNPGHSPILDNQDPSAPGSITPTTDPNGGAGVLASGVGIGAGIAAVAAPGLIRQGYSALTTPKSPDLNRMSPDQVLNHLADQERAGSARPAVTGDGNGAGGGHGKAGLLRNMMFTAAGTIASLALVTNANAEEAPNADGNTPVPADNPELALAQTEALQVEATAQEVTTVEADTGFDLAGEAGHFAHVAGHGLQNGLIGLAASPEAMWDMVDGWTGGALWGDHESSFTEEGLQNAAPIPMPEIRNEFDAAVHGGAELATWLIPVGGALKAAGAGARVVNTVRGFETAENVVNTAAIGSAATTVGLITSDAYLGTHFMAAANGQIVPQNPMAVFDPNAGDAGITGPNANVNQRMDLAM